MSTRQQGEQGERIASNYLENKGLKFLDSNWYCKVGEIDLIMQEGPVRVLVEVRRRAPTAYGSAEETVNLNKQKKLLKAAKAYQQRENYWGDLRFDVVTVVMDEGSDDTDALINHIPDAFGE